MNCALSRKDNNSISNFLIDCIRKDNNLIGSNMKLLTSKKLEDFWILTWTNDIANPIFDDFGILLGYDKKVSDLIPLPAPSTATRTSHMDYEAAVRVREQLSSLTYAQLESYVKSNVTDLQSVKDYLVKLSKVVLAIIKMQDKE